MNEEQRSHYEGLREEARRVFASEHDESRDARLRDLFAQMARVMMQDRENLRAERSGASQ